MDWLNNQDSVAYGREAPLIAEPILRYQPLYHAYRVRRERPHEYEIFRETVFAKKWKKRVCGMHVKIR